MNKTWKFKSYNIYVLLTLWLCVSVVFANTDHIYQSHFYFMSIIFSLGVAVQVFFCRLALGTHKIHSV